MDGKKKRRKNTTSSHFRISKMKSLLLIVLLTLTSSSIGDALLRRKKGKKTMLASASVGARESKEKAPTTWGGGSVRCIFHNLFNTFGICIHIYIYKHSSPLSYSSLTTSHTNSSYFSHQHNNSNHRPRKYFAEWSRQKRTLNGSVSRYLP